MPKIAEEMLTIAGVPTYLRRVGEGPPVLVVHGGPGFSQGYLHGLAGPIQAHRTVVFYDQPGCGRSKGAGAADAALTYRHFAELVDSLFPTGDLGIIAHSWGVVVALGGCAAGMRRREATEGLLVAPVPVTRAGYDRASQNLFSRIPPATQERYLQLAAEGRSSEVVDLLLPFYFAKPVAPGTVGLEIDIATFAGVTASLGDFDFTARLPFFRGCDALTTGGDFCTPDLLEDILAVVSHRDFLPEVGHFPVHEAPAATGAILQRVFHP
jgi:pimeloyl-ACP methyl ester carboxylesterase